MWKQCAAPERPCRCGDVARLWSSSLDLHRREPGFVRLSRFRCRRIHQPQQSGLAPEPEPPKIAEELPRGDLRKRNTSLTARSSAVRNFAGRASLLELQAALESLLVRISNEGTAAGIRACGAGLEMHSRATIYCATDVPVDVILYVFVIPGGDVRKMPWNVASSRNQHRSCRPA